MVHPDFQYTVKTRYILQFCLYFALYFALYWRIFWRHVTLYVTPCKNTKKYKPIPGKIGRRIASYFSWYFKISLGIFEPPTTAPPHRKPWHYRTDITKINIINILPNLIFYVDSDYVSGGGRIDVVVMVYGSNRRRRKICTCRATS